jgi:hypothetical protein
MAPVAGAREPRVILYGHLNENAKLGANTLLLEPGTFSVSRVCHELQEFEAPREPFEFTFFNESQWRAREASYAWLAETLGCECEGRQPFVAFCQASNGETVLYHLLTSGPRGLLFVAYDRSKEHDLKPETIRMLLQRSEAKWQDAHPCFNHGGWFSKWKPDIEMERKFTFSQPVDIWQLSQKLYRNISDYRYKGWIPEILDEYQVWDFDNHMFEVKSGGQSAGYISFIPQADGRMTAKHKRFQSDGEFRFEDLRGGLPLTLDQIEDYARQQCPGQALRRFPPFRRKKIDIKLESLDSGNVYGIFFDICRPHGDRVCALYQCEVEYLRSRVLAPIWNVEEEYRQICSLTRDFLVQERTAFDEGFYSKLSFMRDYVAAQEKERRLA